MLAFQLNWPSYRYFIRYVRNFRNPIMKQQIKRDLKPHPHLAFSAK